MKTGEKVSQAESKGVWWGSCGWRKISGREGRGYWSLVCPEDLKFYSQNKRNPVERCLWQRPSPVLGGHKKRNCWFDEEAPRAEYAMPFVRLFWNLKQLRKLRAVRSLKPQNHKTDHLGCIFSPRNAQRSGPAWREMLGFAGQRGGGWTCRWWTMDSPPGYGDSEEIPHMRLGDVVRDLWTGWRVKIKKMGGWQTRPCLYLTRREKCGAAQ